MGRQGDYCNFSRPYLFLFIIVSRSMSISFDSLKGFLMKTTFVFFFCLRQWLSPVSPQKQEPLVVENTNSICRPQVIGVLRFQATKKVKFFHPIFYRHMHGVWCKLKWRIQGVGPGAGVRGVRTPLSDLTLTTLRLKFLHQ